jgi:hypothetical protein
MPSDKTLNGSEYTVWNSGHTQRGSAREILATIKANARADSTIKKLKLEDYARSLIRNAPYFVPAAALDFLRKQSYDSEFDQALQYLAAMPSSDLRILKVA